MRHTQDISAKARIAAADQLASLIENPAHAAPEH